MQALAVRLITSTSDFKISCHQFATAVVEAAAADTATLDLGLSARAGTHLPHQDDCAQPDVDGVCGLRVRLAAQLHMCTRACLGYAHRAVPWGCLHCSWGLSSPLRVNWGVRQRDCHPPHSFAIAIHRRPLVYMQYNACRNFQFAVTHTV